MSSPPSTNGHRATEPSQPTSLRQPTSARKGAVEACNNGLHWGGNLIDNFSPVTSLQLAKQAHKHMICEQNAPGGDVWWRPWSRVPQRGFLKLPYSERSCSPASPLCLRTRRYKSPARTYACPQHVWRSFLTGSIASSLHGPPAHVDPWTSEKVHKNPKKGQEGQDTRRRPRYKRYVSFSSSNACR
jgi:hypothetical protein